MWQTIVIILAGVALVGSGYFYFLHWVKPKKIISWYMSTLQGLNYRVLALPYHPFKITLSDIRKFNQKEQKDACYQQKHSWPNYDIVITNTGSIVTLILLKPVLLKGFFSPDKQHLFKKSLSNKVGFNLVLKDSLILNDTEHWKRKRKIFTDILNFDFIRSKVPKIVSIAQNVVESMEKECSKIVLGDEFRCFSVQMVPLFQKIMAEIVIKTFFGAQDADLSLDGISINRCITEVLIQSREQSGDWAVLLLKEKAYQWGVMPKYKNLYIKIRKMRQQIKTFLQQKISQASSQKLKTYTNLFQALIYLKQSRNQSKDILSTQQFISQFCAFMSASNDSTANFLNGLFYYLSKNKEVFETLKTKIRNVIRKPQDLTFAKIRSIQYLQWCLNETLRMYGPGTSILLREADKDTYIENIPIMKGTGLKIEMLASHYNSKYYKEPFKFDPLRWQNQDIDPYKLGGFGLGAHACLGKSLALAAAKIITVVLLDRYERIEIEGQKQDLDFIFQGTYRPEPFTTVLYKPRKKGDDPQFVSMPALLPEGQ